MCSEKEVNTTRKNIIKGINDRLLERIYKVSDIYVFTRFGQITGDLFSVIHCIKQNTSGPNPRINWDEWKKSYVLCVKALNLYLKLVENNKDICESEKNTQGGYFPDLAEVDMLSYPYELEKRLKNIK